MDIVKKDIGGNAEAEVVLYQPDSSIHIEVLVEGETINIFRDGELQQENNVHFLHVNGVKKPVPYYNLDVIISVGYRVHSLRADHEREYGVGRHIKVMRYRTNFHDRFLIVDEDVYHIGASLKDLGKRLFAFDKMGLSKELILSQVR